MSPAKRRASALSSDESKKIRLDFADTLEIFVRNETDGAGNKTTPEQTGEVIEETWNRGGRCTLLWRLLLDWMTRYQSGNSVWNAIHDLPWNCDGEDDLLDFLSDLTIAYTNMRTSRVAPLVRENYHVAVGNEQDLFLFKEDEVEDLEE
ncbi:hypothetical protein Slin15195_G085880 [Septoria linicola]|uniref:Uncharacterized protein n=1 Tax=Septoria linicola TaxID=215465 RepID=A0A9Q9AUW5_9PEZI|nr:hypothetical protein Slin14017_G088470 [Septoria linicola]USW55269.1 hypothetical protein Slin15195_G085880 [Septoria linicola]